MGPPEQNEGDDDGDVRVRDRSLRAHLGADHRIPLMPCRTRERALYALLQVVQRIIVRVSSFRYLGLIISLAATVNKKPSAIMFAPLSRALCIEVTSEAQRHGEPG